MPAAAAAAAAVQRVTATLARVALNPALTAALLYVLTRGPASLRARLTSRVAALRDPARLAATARALKWLLVLGAGGAANRALNVLALNSWRVRGVRARWAWEREVAVVTGGSSGIGALIVQRLVGRRVRVVVLDVAELPGEMRGNKHIVFLRCDITNPDAVFAAAKQIKEQLGAPSILVNNAGILDAHTILATKHAYLRKIFDVNVLSNWTTVQAFLPDMIAQDKGHIVTVASGASYVGVAGMADYTATKAAILSFHEGLNQELRLSYKAPGVLTTSIHPGWVRTPLLAPVVAELEKRGAAVMDAEDVANAVAKQVFGCRGAQVFLPESAWKSSLIRALPNWVQEGIRMGVSKTITESVEVGGM
ncbi:short-chain dehydrogenase reductase 2 [Stagonosporopsis vannaccii]|nr:short-chain dehydrogenase reductase 2 [Stagonosporopsis vannaccii]